MKNSRRLFVILSFIVVISTGCACDIPEFLPGGGGCDPSSTFFPGEGIPWTFNVINQSDRAIMIKVTPLRNREGRDDTQDINRNPLAIVDGPIVEKPVAQGVLESLVVRTGKSFGGSLDDPSVFRSFTFEIMGLNTGAIISFGWPVEGAQNTTVQYYGLGYVYSFGPYSYVSPHQLLSSLVPGHYLCSDPIYNVIVESSTSIKWSLDDKVKLDCDPFAPAPP